MGRDAYQVLQQLHPDRTVYINFKSAQRSYLLEMAERGNPGWWSVVHQQRMSHHHSTIGSVWLVTLTNSTILWLASVENITAMLNISHWRPRLSPAWDPQSIVSDHDPNSVISPGRESSNTSILSKAPQFMAQDKSTNNTVKATLCCQYAKLGIFIWHARMAYYYNTHHTLLRTKEISILYRRHALFCCLDNW